MELAQLRSKVAYQSAVLGGVALLTAAALAVADRLTAADIRAAQEQDVKQSLTQVMTLPYDNNMLQDTLKLPGKPNEVLVYRARQAGRVVAVVFQVQAPGYSGPVISMMGLDRDGHILGVRIVKHTETPGLGDKVEPAKSPWVLSFTGKWLGQPPLSGWGVKKDGGVIDQFAGATITPRAVVKSVREGLQFFAQNRAQMLDEATGGKP